MKGKLLHAAGQTSEALALYQKDLPDWYQTSGQKSEQLFAKDTPEFMNLLNKNIFELSQFVLNKLSKQIWFRDPEKSLQEKTEEAVMLCNAVKAFQPFMSEESLNALLASFTSDFEAKLKLAKAPKDLTDQIRKVSR